MNKKGIAILLFSLFFAFTAFAQGRRALRINEVMVKNDSNYIDDYGQRTAWIELYNSSYGAMEISTMYLTNDPKDPTKYPIPRGDVLTEMQPRQHLVFFADNDPNKGTFHLSFTLIPGKDNWIGIYDTDGKTLIDQVTVPANLKPNCTYALNQDGESAGDAKFDPSFWGIRDGSASKYITPGSNNVIVDKNAKAANFSKNDPAGIIMTLIAMTIVFIALILLSVCFILFGKISTQSAKKRKAEAHGADSTSREVVAGVESDSGEAIAAICFALYQHLNAHDQEENVLTINKVRRIYSPWSSKIYSLRQMPERKF
jgi:Na+-transporting methylmalonyl-CoA/oxaloacetate decarboxylase gamma subunit